MVEDKVRIRTSGTSEELQACRQTLTTLQSLTFFNKKLTDFIQMQLENN